jgi:hypothetical protein
VLDDDGFTPLATFKSMYAARQNRQHASAFVAAHNCPPCACMMPRDIYVLGRGLDSRAVVRTKIASLRRPD